MLTQTQGHHILHDNHITDDIQKPVAISSRMSHDNIDIDNDSKRFLIQPSKPGSFYIILRIDRQGNPGRLIVSSNGYLTEHLSQFLSYRLQTIVQPTSSSIYFHMSYSNLKCHLTKYSQLFHHICLVKSFFPCFMFN